MNKVTGRDMVHKELAEYHRLKKRWGQGHIKIILSKCGEKYCSAKARPKRILHENMRNKHTIVLGHYLDKDDNTEKWEFLGYTLKDAHARLEYVKRFFFLSRATGTGYPLKSKSSSFL